MGDFFGSIYCWFEDFFGIELADYLWGATSPDQTTNMFIGIGLSMLGISLAIAVLYYYVINHPKLGNWWGWGIFLVINGIINFFVGWQWVLADKYEGLMITIDPSTNIESELPISPSDILCFGVANMILSLIAFILISFIIKWGSHNCSNSPL